MHFIKGKIIIAFLSGCIALYFAWEASRQASIEILKNVNSLSAPVDRLHIVNRLFRDINRLEQEQRALAIAGNTQDTVYLQTQSLELRKSLDTLGMMYAGDTSQLAHISSMKTILKERDSLFSNYIKVREGLVDSKELSRQLQTLTKIYSNTPVLVEKVITTERTSIATVNSAEEKEKDSRSFFGRLFSKKKSEKKSETKPLESIPNQELASETLAVKIDTISTATGNADSLKKEIEKARRTIVSTQRSKSTSFINREAALVSAGNVLINQMLNVLQEVARDAVAHVERNNTKTKSVVEDGARNIINIILLFVLATAILLYLILTDISRSARYRKQLEVAKDEAEHHSAVRQRFLANMSHEIRTPLQSIIGYSDRLRHQSDPDRTAIDAIHYSSEHLLQIVNEILDYSRLASGKFSLNFTAFNIQDLLSEVISVMQPEAGKKSLRLILHNHTEVHVVIGDAFRLKQILLNLLSNAVKFTDEGTVSLEVSASETENKYQFTFSVKDTGHGIAKENIKHIFNQFEQVNTSAVAATKGTGLGLSIVKELVELQGGSIDVISEPGKGSCFRVNLDFQKSPEAIPSTEVSEVYVPDSNLKVYLVDDDDLILQLCCAILDKHDIKHECFSSPYGLLENLTNPDESVVLADIRMPEMSGLELCRELRKKSSSLKIFAMTAQALPDEQEKILEAGFDGILMKPFREADLVSLLKGNMDENSTLASVQSIETDLDISSMEQMTFGDKGLLIKLLKQYVRDTEEDLKSFKELEVNDGQVSFLLHRLAGRSSQVGAARLAALMRELEILSMEETADGSSSITKDDINGIAKEVALLIKKLEQEINRLSDTSPSYNTTFSGQY